MQALPEAGAGGTLFVVATPIGNLGDVTQRAIDTLRSVPVVAAEDTRRTRGLLTHFGITARLISYHAHNRRARIDTILRELTRGDVALVTDAGTPVVSDPGQELVRAAWGAGHTVSPIPGPSALTAALSICGLPAAEVHFIGFVPRRRSERRRTLVEAMAWPGLLVFFEAPHRLRATLADALAVAGDRPVVVCCELTKLFESVYRGTLSGAIEVYSNVEPRGEFTLVLDLGAGAGAGQTRADSAAPEVDLEARLEALTAALGDRKRALSALAKETGRPRKELYAGLLARRPPT